MHIFSSCVLVKIFVILAPSFATPTPNPQDADVCAAGVGVSINQPIATIDYPFKIRVIPTTDQTPSLDLGYRDTGAVYLIELGNTLPFNLTNNVLSTTDQRFDKSGFRVVNPYFDDYTLSDGSGALFRQIQRCVGNTPIDILQPFAVFGGRLIQGRISVVAIRESFLVHHLGATQVPAGQMEVLFQIVPI